MTLFKRKSLVKIFLILSLAFLIGLPALAQDNFGLDPAGEIGLGSNDPQSIIVNIIKIALGFLGLLAVIIIILGGFKFMVSGGSDESSRAAGKTIISGIIGLIIILSAWGIVNWLISTGVNITS